MSRPTHCHLCGAASAPFHYRRPGLFSELPAGERGVYLRACSECQDAAEARWRRKFNLDPKPAASAPPARPRPADPAPPRSAGPDLFSRLDP